MEKTTYGNLTFQLKCIRKILECILCIPLANGFIVNWLFFVTITKLKTTLSQPTYLFNLIDLYRHYKVCLCQLIKMST